MTQYFSATIHITDQNPYTHKAILVGCPENISTEFVSLLLLMNEWEQRQHFEMTEEERCFEDRAEFFLADFIHVPAQMQMYGDTDFSVTDIKAMTDEEFAAAQIVKNHFEHFCYDFDIIERFFTYVNHAEFDESLFNLKFHQSLKQTNPLLACVCEYMLDLKHNGVYEFTEECLEGLLEHLADQPSHLQAS